MRQAWGSGGSAVSIALLDEPRAGAPWGCGSPVPGEFQCLKGQGPAQPGLAWELVMGAWRQELHIHFSEMLLGCCLFSSVRFAAPPELLSLI